MRGSLALTCRLRRRPGKCTTVWQSFFFAALVSVSVRMRVRVTFGCLLLEVPSIIQCFPLSGGGGGGGDLSADAAGVILTVYRITRLASLPFQSCPLCSSLSP